MIFSPAGVQSALNHRGIKSPLTCFRQFLNEKLPEITVKAGNLRVTSIIDGDYKWAKAAKPDKSKIGFAVTTSVTSENEKAFIVPFQGGRDCLFIPNTNPKNHYKMMAKVKDVLKWEYEPNNRILWVPNVERKVKYSIKSMLKGTTYKGKVLRDAFQDITFSLTKAGAKVKVVTEMQFKSKPEPPIVLDKPFIYAVVTPKKSVIIAGHHKP